MAVLAGCQQDANPHDGSRVPLYRGMVAATPPGRPHLELRGQDRWVYLTKADPSGDAESMELDLKDYVGKDISVEGILIPGTGWIYNAEILK